MSRKIRRALPWMMVVAAYVLTITFYGLFGAHNLSGDDASEMVHAALLNEEGKWVQTESWLYSTELRIVSPTILYQIGLKLFASWAAARTFAQAVSLLLVLGTFLYFARELGLKKSTPYLAAVLMLPFNNCYDYVITFGLHYAVHLMLSFVILGLVLRIGRAKTKGTVFLLAALALLGIWSGFGGVRMLLMIIAPMFAAAVLLFLVEIKTSATFREALATPQARMAGASSLCMAAMLAGYAAGVKILTARYTYSSYTDIRMTKFKASELINQFSSLLCDLGYTSNVELMSLQGINNLIAIVIFMALAAALWRMKVRWAALNPSFRMLVLTAVMAIVIGMLSNVMLGQILTRYFTVGTVLLFVVLALALEIEPCKNALVRTFALLCMTGCCAFGAQNEMRYNYTLGNVNYEMAADWLVENGYTQGYATYWNANLLTAASDGKIDMWVLADSSNHLNDGMWRRMGMQRFLQEKYKLHQMPEGKVFLLVTEEEQKEGSPLLDPAHYVGMIAWSYHVYEYDSAVEMYVLVENAKTFE